MIPLKIIKRYFQKTPSPEPTKATPAQAQAQDNPKNVDSEEEDDSLIDWEMLTTGSKIELITAIVIPSVIGFAVIIEVLMRQNPQNVPVS